MIPLSDASRRPLNFPFVNALIIAANVAMFALELMGGDPFVERWVLVPAQIVAGRDWITILSAMFMHAGWIHIGGNLLFLSVFGPEIEDVMGPARYLAFYLLGGLASTAAQIAIDPTSMVPNLGASGAIAAVMGAFLVTFPRDQIRTVLLIGWFVRITLLPAILLVGLWFLIQLFSEIGTLAAGGIASGVAYMAHIGGFIFGMIASRLFETRQRRHLEGLD